MSDDHLNLPAGTTLDGKWCVEGLLGAGGMGTVFRARHVRNGREAAIKVLHPMVAADPSAKERFLHEGYAANQVGHPGTVQVLDDGIAREGAYLVMELLEGAPIDKLAEANGDVLPLPAMLSIMDASLSVLAAAHEKGIIHRDFKPENLFLTSERQLKMLDFGLARVRETTTGMRLTATGVPMGTPAFMPPEQALAHWDEVDARSDVYAVGATMWTLLTGQLVHDARTAPELLVMASTRQAPSILTKFPSLPPAIAAVIDRALAFNRMARYANAGEMKLALSRAVHESGMTFAPLAATELTGTNTHDPSENPTTPKQRAAAAFQPTATVAPITTDSQSARKSKAQVYLIMGIAAFAGIAGGAAFFFFGGGRNNPQTASNSLAADETPPSNTVRVAPTLEVSAAPSGEPTPTVSASSAQPTASAIVSTAPPTASVTVRTTAAAKTATPVVSSQPTSPQPPKKCDPFKEYCK